MADAQRAAMPGVEPGTTLDRIFDQGRLVRDAHQIDNARSMLDGFLQEAVQAGRSVDGSAKRAIAERIAAIDRLVSAQVNEVLHHPKFQGLEASWRSLDKLIAENEISSSLKVQVFNTHRKELERDFSRAPGFDQSHFFKSVYEDEYGTLGGSPYTFLIGDMDFGRAPPDIQLLREIGAVASMAHAPFIASASPRLFDLDSFTELDRPIDIAKIFESSEMGGVELAAGQRRRPLSRAHRTAGSGAAALGPGLGSYRRHGLRRGGRWRGPQQVPLWAVLVGTGRAHHEVLCRVRLAIGDPGDRIGRQGRESPAPFLPLPRRVADHQVSDRDHHHGPSREGTVGSGDHRSLSLPQHGLRCGLLRLDGEPTDEVRGAGSDCQRAAVRQPAVPAGVFPIRALPEGHHARQGGRIYLARRGRTSPQQLDRAVRDRGRRCVTRHQGPLPVARGAHRSAGRAGQARLVHGGGAPASPLPA